MPEAGVCMHVPAAMILLDAVFRVLQAKLQADMVSAPFRIILVTIRVGGLASENPFVKGHV